jgi:hypothetical protein
MERLGEALLAVLLGLLAGLQPHAAMGAAVGCFFFLASPASTNRRQRLLLAVFSCGMGYAAGVFTYPNSEKAMLIAGSVSALVAVIWTGLHRMAVADGPLPEWVKDTLGFIPMFRRKEPDDGP